MALNSRVVWLYLGLPILGIAAAVCYYLSIKDDEEDLIIASSGNRVVEVRVPTSKVGALIGKKGVNINEIQNQTNTKINFKEVDGDQSYTICQIRGTAENAQHAESIIISQVTSAPMTETIEYMIPQNACARVIGRNGDTIRCIQDQSHAIVKIDRNVTDKSGMRLVTIKGTSEQVALAKSLIQAKVDEEAANQLHLNKILRSRPQRILKNQNETSDKRVSRIPKLEYENLEIAEGSLTECFVSSVSSPHIFWVQRVNKEAVHLDRLLDTMTDFYNRPENADQYKLTKAEKGQLVAVPFPNDSNWYRAEVCDIEEKDGQTILDVFYVDYGDSLYFPLSECRELQPEFYSLKGQAIECCLSGVKPKNGISWTTAEVDVFEELANVAKWVKVLVTVEGYTERINSNRSLTDPKPVVRIYSDEPSHIDIGEELVRRGAAAKVETDKEPSKSTPNGEDSKAATPGMDKPPKKPPRLMSNNGTPNGASRN